MINNPENIIRKPAGSRNKRLDSRFNNRYIRFLTPLLIPKSGSPGYYIRVIREPAIKRFREIQKKPGPHYIEEPRLFFSLRKILNPYKEGVLNPFLLGRQPGPGGELVY